MMYERLLISELYKRLVTRTKNENQSLYATQTKKMKAEEEAAVVRNEPCVSLKGSGVA